MSIHYGAKVLSNFKLLKFSTLMPSTLYGKIKKILTFSIIISFVFLIPITYLNTIYLSHKINSKITYTIVKLIEKDISQQLNTIDIEGINKTLGVVEDSIKLNIFCLFNKQKILLKSKNSTCTNLNQLEAIYDNNKNVSGYFYVKNSENYYEIVIYQLLIFFSLVLIFVSIALIMTLKLKNIIIKPLCELNASLTDFYHTNDFHIRAPLAAEDEIGQLALTFNRLLKEMQSKEHQLIKAKNLADEASTLKSDFLASVSHEIRTPMNGIIGTAELLIESLDTAKHKNYTNTILRSAENLLSIINDILDFSKIESGKFDIDSIPYNLYSEVEDVADLMTIKATEKNIEIIVAISPYVPEFVIGDPKRLRQVITNLMNNAVKFTGNGHVLIEIESVGYELNDEDEKVEEIRFSVIDTGIGIPEEHQIKIFERFTQAESSTTREYGGTGLGLAICKQLIELQGGKIELESTVGNGSNFHFSLKFKTDNTKKILETNLENTSLIIIDDNPYLLEHLKSTLRFHGLTVYCTKSSKEVFSIIDENISKNKPIDAVLISENLSNESGVDIGEKIHLNYMDNSPAIIILTSTTVDINREKLFKSKGFNAHIQKPIRLKQLIDLISLSIYESKQGNKDLLCTESFTLKANGLKNTPAFSNPKILIIDSNKINYQFISSLLVKSGCNIINIAENMLSYELILEKQINLIIINADYLGVNYLKRFIDEYKSDNGMLFNKNNVDNTSDHYIPIIGISDNEINFNFNSIINNIDCFINKNNFKDKLIHKISVLIPHYVLDKDNGIVNFNNTNILLVEDNRVNSQIAMEILQEFGCKVEVSEDGRLGIEAYKKNNFDMILMDCQMPVMDGFETTRYIRHFEKINNKKAMPIVALTASAMKGDSELCYKSGMNDYIAKPIKRDDLLSVLKKYIDPKKSFLKIKSLNISDIFISDSKRVNEIIFLTKNYPINIFNCLSEIEKTINILIENISIDPVIKIHDVVNCIIPICKAMAFNRITLLFEHLAETSLSFHREEIKTTHLLRLILNDCRNAVSDTILFIHEHALKAPSIKTHVFDELEEVVLGLPDSLEKKDENLVNDVFISESKTKIPTVFKAQKNINFTSDEIVDFPIFENIQSIFKIKIYSLIVDYVEDSDNYIKNIRNGIEKNNFDFLRENAHPLKSSSLTLGFMAVGNSAKNIELLAKEKKHIKLIDKEYKRLTSLYEETLKFIYNFQEKNKPINDSKPDDYSEGK